VGRIASAVRVSASFHTDPVTYVKLDSYSNSYLDGKPSVLWSSLKTGPAQLGHVKIALDITAVDIDLFFLYCTGAMIIYDRFSL